MGVISRIVLGVMVLGLSGLLGQEPGTIVGLVSDFDTGEPLADVQVYINKVSVGDITNSEGMFSLGEVNPGKYKIKASMMGYRPEARIVSVVSGLETGITLYLKAVLLEAEASVVTATKINKDVKNIGGSVYMIHESELRQSDSRNVQDIITRVPGVFTQDKFHSESNVITFRGVGLHTYVTRGILVLVDGISVNEAMGRSVFEGINLENAQKVEILKGPVSALYGPNGITGVINIVTKKAPEDFEGALNYTRGAHNSKRVSGQLGTTLGKIGINTNALLYSSDGYLDRNSFDTKKISTRLSTDNEKIGSLDGTFDYSESVTDYPGALTREQYDEGETTSSNQYAGSDKVLMRLGLRNEKSLNEKLSFVSNIYYRSRTDLGHYLDFRYGDSDLSLIGGEVQLHSKLIQDRVRFVTGVSHDQETGVSKTYNRDTDDGSIGDITGNGTSTYQITGVYGQADISLLADLTTTLGVRYDNVAYDWQDNFEPDSSNTSATTSIGALSPKFGFTYNPLERLTLFGNWGRGFNPPEMDNLFSSDPESNPDLKPEYLSNIELGLRGGVGYRVNYQISAFKMDFVDQIVKDEETEFFENIGDTEHNGVEVMINAMFLKNMMVYLNYAYLQTAFTDHPDYEGKSLTKTPENQFGTGLRLTLFDDLNLSLDYQWMDEFYMDNEEIHVYGGHSLVNAKLRYTYKIFTSSLSINNVMDIKYATSAAARSAYNYRTREYEWIESFYPGWPRNFNLTFGIIF